MPHDSVVSLIDIRIRWCGIRKDSLPGVDGGKEGKGREKGRAAGPQVSQLTG